jgi:tRNA-splicing ligase RtcB
MLKYAAKLAQDGFDAETIVESVKDAYSVVPKLQLRPRKTLKYAVFGADQVPSNAMDQMDMVMRIPPAQAGALMPDAHHGYAMPIGGVVALHEAVSPSFVGYDIACRMMVSVLDMTPEELMHEHQFILDDMQAVTSFGVGSDFPTSERREDPVMDDPLWQDVIPELYPTAVKQLGSSGGGNHFFDALLGEVVSPKPWLHGRFGMLQEGDKFVAIMTHSGSRGAGHKSATKYLKLAKQETKNIARGIPAGYEWLSLFSGAGQEYWEIMQLMGRYAQANHRAIHREFIKRTGIEVFTSFENHHNFAWRQGGWIIHRKGATPAHKGEIGIIPGSSGTSSFLVEGLGNKDSLYSSSHGAGRNFSRSEAKRRHDPEAYRAGMGGILTAGVAEDETFMAYKDIDRIIEAQDGVLVDVVAKMYPKIVVMGGK